MTVDRLWRTAVLAVLLTGIAGCKGAEGPIGPIGPQGAQGATGPQGPAGTPGQVRLNLSGTLDASGNAFRDLSAAVGTASNPPLFACYVYVTPGAWVPVAELGGHCAIGTPTGQTFLRIAMTVPNGAGASYEMVVLY